MDAAIGFASRFWVGIELRLRMYTPGTCFTRRIGVKIDLLGRVLSLS